MTSWKRLFGKKTKKDNQKLETRYAEWLRKLQNDQIADAVKLHTQKNEEPNKKKS